MCYPTAPVVYSGYPKLSGDRVSLVGCNIMPAGLNTTGQVKHTIHDTIHDRPHEGQISLNSSTWFSIHKLLHLTKVKEEKLRLKI